MSNPTKATYTNLDTAFAYFNRHLFENQLPPCLITMQRHNGTYGYFSRERFVSVANLEELTDEIALNPAYFAHRKPIKVLSTLVHEMCHLWQHHFGKPPSHSYHNKEWAAKMVHMGLLPTASGERGGKQTGQKMTHLIQAQGCFALVATQLLAEYPAVLYHDRSSDQDAKTGKTKAASKTKYTCPSCGLNAWAKPQVILVCGNCLQPMEADEQTERPAMKSQEVNEKKLLT